MDHEVQRVKTGEAHVIRDVEHKVGVVVNAPGLDPSREAIDGKVFDVIVRILEAHPGEIEKELAAKIGRELPELMEHERSYVCLMRLDGDAKPRKIDEKAVHARDRYEFATWSPHRDS